MFAFSDENKMTVGSKHMKYLGDISHGIMPHFEPGQKWDPLFALEHPFNMKKLI